MSGKTILSHVGKQRSIIATQHRRLNCTEAEQRLTGIPGRTAIVADRHNRDRERVGIKRQQDSTRWQHCGFATRLPTHALIEFLAQLLLRLFNLQLLFFGKWYRQCGKKLIENSNRFRREIIGLKKNRFTASPLRAPIASGIVTNLEMSQA